jgi:hypothetical protein
MALQTASSGDIQPFLHGLCMALNFQEDTEDEGDDGQNGAFLANKIEELYKTEVAVYEKLRAHQGRNIPRLLATVELDLAPADVVVTLISSGNGVGFEPLKVNGMLLQYIDGCTLGHQSTTVPVRACKVSSMRLYLPSASWATTISSKTEIYNRADPVRRRSRVGKRQTQHGRGGSRGSRDEAVAGHHGFELRYEESRRYWQWAAREGADDGFCKDAIRREVRPGVVGYEAPWFAEKMKTITGA